MMDDGLPQKLIEVEYSVDAFRHITSYPSMGNFIGEYFTSI